MDEWMLLFFSGVVFFKGLFHLIKYTLRHTFGNSITDVTNHLISLRLVSAIQAVLACTAGIVIIANCSYDVINARYWLATGYTIFGVPYMYYDLWAMYTLYCLQNPSILKEGFLYSAAKYVKSHKVMTVHHVIFPIIYFPFIVWLRRGSGDFFVGCFYLFELPVPFISLRAILKQFDINDTVYGTVNGLLTITSFLLSRILIFPFMFYAYGRQYGYLWYQVPLHIPIKCSVGCVGLLSLQVYWQIQMFILLYQTLQRWCHKSDAPCELHHKNGITSNVIHISKEVKGS